MFDFIRHWYQRRTMYVIADSRDNSMTFSKRLFDSLGGFDTKCDELLVFTVGGKKGKRYAFTNEHKTSEKTDFMKMQYNSKHKIAGFECRLPSVNRIFYDYGMPSEISCKLSVEIHKSKGFRYYVIVPPHPKAIKRLWKKYRHKDKEIDV